MQIISPLSRQFISLYYVDPCLVDMQNRHVTFYSLRTRLWNFSDTVILSVRYVDGASDPSDPTPGKLLKFDKAGDMEWEKEY